MKIIKIVEFLKCKLEFLIFLIKYRKVNSHNRTSPANNFRLEKIIVGNNSYGEIDIIDYSDADTRVEIGHYCSIAPGVKFLLGGDHSLQYISNFPFKAKFGLVEREAPSKGSIILKDDVWIGTNSLILSGVTIGQGAVVAAGSVVTKDVPSYSIVAGVPAKIVKYRFENEIIEKLLTIDYSKFDKNKIEKKINTWYTPVNEQNIDSLLKEIS